MFRHPQEAEERRKRMKSEMSTALYYPSYLERGPDYEAEMRYFSGDTLSPRDSKVIDEITPKTHTLGFDLFCHICMLKY